MDVSPIQRLAVAANQAVRHVPVVRDAPAVTPATPAAQAGPAAADQEKAPRPPVPQPTTDVVVTWHAASLGFVTKIVDQHTGDVVLQTPPQQVLEMVQKFIERLEGDAA